MKLKTLIFSLLILLNIKCGTSAPPLPPFKYEDNSRIILEGVLLNSDGSPVQNQAIELSSNRYENIEINSTISDSQGNFFISAPKANYVYSLAFKNKNIISIQFYKSLLVTNPNDPWSYLGYIPNLTENYYDFKIIKIK